MIVALRSEALVKSNFMQDVEDWFLRRRSGHMIRHYYSGKALAYWEAFTRNSTEYYLFDEESNLINENLSYLIEKYKPARNFSIVELGTGGMKSAKQKTVPFVKEFRPDQYIAVDWSEESAALVAAAVEMETTVKTDLRISDFNKNDLALPNSDKILLQLGSTLSNIECFPEQDFPFENLVKNLQNYRNNMHKNDILIIGIDQNNDADSLISSYSHSYHIAFSESILHRVKEELPVSSNFNPDYFNYRPIWVPEKRQLIHALVANTSGQFMLGGSRITFEKDDIFSYDNSFKFDQSLLEKAYNNAGLSLIDVIKGPNISLQILQAL